MKKIHSAAIVRFGQTFYVVGFDTYTPLKGNMTELTAKKNAIATFSFNGVANKDNPEAAYAYRQAQACVRKFVR